MTKKFNFVCYTFLIVSFISSILNIDGYIIPTSYLKGTTTNSKKQNLKLRNNYENMVFNEKYIYMKYLIGIRNFKKIYRVVKDNSNIDIQNIINILNILNYINNTNIANITENNPIFINNEVLLNTSLIINNTNHNNDDKIAKHLILSNIYIDVSKIKYIQISTRNDTLIVELDKNNADLEQEPNNINNILLDIGKIDTLISSISLLMKFLNIN
jgi:hypothetical protein|uniref:Uncharacterized protein n=1 Tax=viral metagenome TaxID=1070528 RepID=A0A6C0LVR4_9ZZZZ